MSEEIISENKVREGVIYDIQNNAYYVISKTSWGKLKSNKIKITEETKNLKLGQKVTLGYRADSNGPRDYIEIIECDKEENEPYQRIQHITDKINTVIDSINEIDYRLYQQNFKKQERSLYCMDNYFNEKDQFINPLKNAVISILKEHPADMVFLGGNKDSLQKTIDYGELFDKEYVKQKSKCYFNIDILYFGNRPLYKALDDFKGAAVLGAILSKSIESGDKKRDRSGIGGKIENGLNTIKKLF
ncbi:MAG: hypothetical protein IJ837_00670 [Clostridia bacterium]|nr:hypothetical protein [Clostridia bacterium]